jgi:hypothetical protein
VKKTISFILLVFAAEVPTALAQGTIIFINRGGPRQQRVQGRFLRRSIGKTRRIPSIEFLEILLVAFLLEAFRTTERLSLLRDNKIIPGSRHCGAR